MTERRERVARLMSIAEDAEQRARARLTEANNQVSTVDRRREAALRRADELSDLAVPLRLQTHLTGAGARYLVTLADEKNELLDEVDKRMADYEAASTKVRSFERLIDRLDRAEALRQDKVAAGELQDLLAIRAARGLT